MAGRWFVACVAFGIGGCGSSTSVSDTDASAIVDASTPPADSVVDGGPVDSASRDVAADRGTLDAGTTDAPTTDAPRIDGTSADAPRTDVALADAPGTDVSSSDATPPADACTRPSIDPTPVMLYCGVRTDGAACPTGYTCLAYEGVVLQEMCGRTCATDCDCASGDVCGSYSDKAGTHRVCVRGS